jgi:glycosyltransferase involved in cell wall biosynthesis
MLSADSRPIRLLLATNNLYLGGAQQLVVTLATRLSRLGLDVAVLNLVGGRDKLAGVPEPLRAPLATAGLTVRDFRIRSNHDLAEWRRAGRWMQAYGPDIVHGHLWPADRWAALLGRMAGARTVTTKHETRTDLPGRDRWAEAVAARLLFDRVIAISEATHSHLRHYLHVPPDRLVTVPNPVDAARFDPDRFDRAAVRRQLGLWPDRADAFVVGYTGRLVERKGLDVWLHAAAIAWQARPSMRFLLVGYGDARPALERLAASLGLGAVVTFAGTQADVAPWLAACDAYLFTPVLGEGLSIALLEAMAMGLPIVASNVGVNREQVGGVGWLPEPAEWAPHAATLDPAHLAGAIVALCDRPDECRRLGQSARTRALERYDLPVVLNRQLAVYHAMLGQRHRSTGRADKGQAT